MSSDLQEIEMKRLMITAIWPKENSMDSQSSNEIQRYVASDLYAPLALHREFGLPILDWKGKWARTTQEGI
jgi:hypothetical protein